MGPVDSALLVILGVLLIFAGRVIIRILASLIFGGFLGLLGFGMVVSAGGGLILGFIVGLLLFLLGLILGFIVFKVGLSLAAGYLLALTVFKILQEKHLLSIQGYEKLALVVLVIVVAVIIYVILDYILALGIGIVASILVFHGMLYWFPRTVSSIIALVILVVGTIYQWRKIKHEEEV